MNRSLSIILYIIAAPLGVLFAQEDTEFDKLMVRKRISCIDVEENARYLIPRYYDASKQDSIRFLLSYWEKKCGSVEPVTRMNILLDAEAGRLSSYPATRLTLYNLLDFKRKSEFVKRHPQAKEAVRDNMRWNERIQLNDPFDTFTALRATEALRNASGTVDSAFLQFYAGNTDSLFHQFNRNQFSPSSFQTMYDSLLNEIESEYVPYITVVVGMWSPLGNAAVLGNHPEIGFSLGAMKYRYSVDLTMVLKFVSSSDPYVVIHQNVPKTTKYFFGGYIAGQFGYDIIQQRDFDISALTGIGYDGFDAVAASNSYANDGTSINSLNINVGAGARVYLDEFRGSFLNFEVRYNFVNYSNTGGTDLSGDAVTFRVGYNFSDPDKFRLLREFGAF